MNPKEKGWVKRLFNFLYSLIFGAILLVILSAITIIYLPFALIVWAVTEKSFAQSWGGIHEGWRILLDILAEIENRMGLK